MKMTQIDIDLDVYKALEAHRTSFNEPHNSILRRLLDIENNVKNEWVVLESDDGGERRSRRGGTYELKLLSTTVRCSSLKEVLKECLLRVESQKSGFLDKLSNYVSPRSGRHIVARQRTGVHPESPQLAQYAERLNDMWWFDTNISRGTCVRYLETIGRVAEIDPPQLIADVALSNELDD